MKISALMFFVIVVPLSANAALINRGGGLIYDSDLNITWLSDANYAMTSGYDLDGLMTWHEAINWAGQLQYAGHDNWRLPSALNDDGSVCSSGECDGSEMGHLHFIELSGLRGISVLPVNDPDYALFNGTIQEGRYWADTVYEFPVCPDCAWWFQFDRGYPGASAMSTQNYAWAVHDGDIGAVPLPAAAWLFCSGIFGLFGMVRRKGM